MNDTEKTLHHANKALASVLEAKSKGENNAQFDSVINYAKALAELNL